MLAPDVRRLDELVDEIGTLRLERADSLDGILEDVRAWLGFDNLSIYAMSPWESKLARWHASPAASPRLRPLAEQLADRGRGQPAPVFYDAFRPQVAQRNVLLEATAYIDRAAPGTWAASTACREVFAPAGLDRHAQYRALLCEGPNLLGWFGTLHPEPASPRQLALFAKLLEPMRRRLAAERRLFGTTTPDTTALLDQLACPAYLVDRSGRIADANALGRLHVDGDRRTVLDELARAALTRTSTSTLGLTWISDDHAIATVQLDSDARVKLRVSACATRWGLTQRQRQVLALVVDGHSNASIAAELGIIERTVEVHVTAILDRVGVDNRTALATAVFAS